MSKPPTYFSFPESLKGVIKYWWIRSLHLFEVNNCEQIIQKTNFHLVIWFSICCHTRTCIHFNQPWFKLIIQHNIKPINLETIRIICNDPCHALYRQQHHLMDLKETPISFILPIPNIRNFRYETMFKMRWNFLLWCKVKFQPSEISLPTDVLVVLSSFLLQRNIC